MESDIVLDGHLVLVKATDILLDADERRSPDGGSPYRRALVHGEGDQLILNFNRDYPRGITLMGSVRLADLELPTGSGTTDSGMVKTGEVGGLAVDIRPDLKQINIPDPEIPELLEKADRADLIATIKALRRGLLVLDKRVKALGG
jgi:hypothetical protein